MLATPPFLQQSCPTGTTSRTCLFLHTGRRVVQMKFTCICTVDDYKFEDDYTLLWDHYLELTKVVFRKC